MQSTLVTVLRTVVRVQRFVDINGETLDRIDRSRDRKIGDASPRISAATPSTEARPRTRSPVTRREDACSETSVA